MKNIIFIILILINHADIFAENYKTEKIDDEFIIYTKDNLKIKFNNIIIDKNNRKVQNILKSLLTNAHIFTENIYRDRNNIIYADIYVNNIYLQEYLLSEGLAYLYVIRPNSNFNKLQIAEQKAISKNLNFWHNKIIDAEYLKDNYYKYLNKFVFVRGNIFEVKESESSFYINFDENYREDLTIIIDKAGLSKEEKNFIPTLINKNITVRGSLSLYNGPVINLQNSVIYNIRDNTDIIPITDPAEPK